MKTSFLNCLLFFLLIQSNCAQMPSTSPIPLLNAGNHIGRVEGLFTIPDKQQIITVGGEGTVRILNAVTGETTHIHSLHKSGYENSIIFATALSPNKQVLAVGGHLSKDKNEIWLIDLASWTIQHVLDGHQEGVKALAYSKDGKHLVSGGQLGDIKVWETKTYSSKTLPTKHKADIIAITIGNNAQFLVASDRSGDLVLWSLENDAYTSKLLKGHPSIPISIEIAGDEGYFVSTDIGKNFGNGGKLIGWTIQGDQLWSSEQFLANHNALGAISIAPDNRHIAFKEDIIGFTATFKVHILDLELGKIVSSLDYHNNTVLYTAFYDNESLVSISAGITKTILTNWKTQQIKHQWQCKGVDVKYSDFDSNGPLYLGFNKITERNRNQKGVSFSLKSFQLAPVYQVPIITSKPTTFEDKKLEKVNSYTVRVAGGETIQFEDSKEGRIQEYFFTRDGNILVVGDFMVKYLNSNGQVLRIFQDRAGEIRSASVSKDNQYLTISGTDQITQIYNFQTEELLASFFFTPDNDWILWSPAGYYASSNPAGSFLSWYSIAADKLPIAYQNNVALQKKYYQPELLKSILLVGSLGKAINRATEQIPPIIRVEKTTHTIPSQKFDLAFQVEAPNDIASIKILVNKQAIDIKDDFKNKESYQSKELLLLQPNSNTIEIIVKDKKGLQTTEQLNLLVEFTPEVLFSSGHSNMITSTCFSPDGKYVASSSMDNTLKIWNFNTGSLHQILDFSDSKWSNNSGIMGAIFHPTDPTKISAFGGQSLFTFDLLTGAVIFNQADQELLFRIGVITGLAYNETGDYLLVTASDGSLKYWNTKTGQIDFQSQIHQSAITALTTTKDGKYLITQGRDNQLKIIDIQHRKIIKEFALGAQTTKTMKMVFRDFIAISNDQHYLAVGGLFKDRIEVYDLQKEQKRYDIYAKQDRFTSVAFSADNQYLAIGSTNKGIQILEPATSNVLHSFTKKSIITEALNFHPSLPILLSGHGIATEFLLRSWQIPNGDLLLEMGNDVRGVTSFALSNNKKYLATSGVDKILWVWDLQTLDLKAKVRAGENDMELLGAYDLAFNATDSLLAVASCDNIIRILDLTTNKFILEKFFDYPVRSIAFHPQKDELFLAEEHIEVWDLLDNTIKQLGNHQGSISQITFDERGNYLGVVSEQELSLWNTIKKEKLVSHPFPNSTPNKSSLHGAGMLGNHAYIDTYGIAITSKAQAIIFSSPLAGTIFKYHIDSGNVETIYQKGQVLPANRYIALALSPDNRYLAATKIQDYIIEIIDVQKKQLIKTLGGHKDAIGKLRFDPTGEQLLSCSKDGTVKIWDWKKAKEIISVVTAMDGNYVFKTVDNYYFSNQQGQNAINFLANSKVFPFEQFDLTLNRPDIVLQRLSSADSNRVQLYKKAYEKRLQKMGFQEDVPQLDFINIPTIEIQLSSTETYTSNPMYTFEIAVDGKNTPIKQVDIFVNDVPIYGEKGLNYAGDRQVKLNQTIALPLSNGRNKIQISATNDSLTNSLKETFYITYEGAPRTPDLYMIGIGVDEYDNAENLNFPQKDVKDLEHFFQTQKEQFKQVKSSLLLGPNFSKESLQALKPILNNTKVDDVVILFYAGHGTVDEKNDFFITSQSANIPYDTLEAILDGIPARQKLIFIDACYSGEIDVEKQPNRDNSTPRENRIFRDTGSRSKNEKTSRSFALMQQLFVDLRRKNGATVISATQGTEQAQESTQWGNGAFTYAILKGLREQKADFDNNGIIRISDLKKYVSDVVPLLTDGQQQPTSRLENISNDFIISTLANSPIKADTNYKSDLDLIMQLYIYANPLFISKGRFKALVTKHKDKFSPNSALLTYMEQVGKKLQQAGERLSPEEISKRGEVYLKLHGIIVNDDSAASNEPVNLDWAGEEMIWLSKRLPEVVAGNWEKYDARETNLGKVLKSSLAYIADNNVSMDYMYEMMQSQGFIEMQHDFLKSFIQ